MPWGSPVDEGSGSLHTGFRSFMFEPSGQLNTNNTKNPLCLPLPGSDLRTGVGAPRYRGAKLRLPVIKIKIKIKLN